MGSTNENVRHKVLPRLRETLAELFPADADQRRVVSEIFPRSDSIAFGGLAVNVWHSILTEAHKLGLIDRLLACPSVRYYVEQHEGLMYCELLWLVSQSSWDLEQVYKIYEVSILTSSNEKAPAYKFDDIADLLEYISKSHGKNSTIQFAIHLTKATNNNKLVQKLQSWIDKASVPEIPTILDDELINKIQSVCDKLLMALEDPRKKTLTAIEQWLNQVVQISPNLLSHPRLQAPLIRIYPSVVEKFVSYARENLQNFKNPESKECEIQDRLDLLFQSFANPDPDIRQFLDDLKFVVAYLFHAEAFQTHDFVDAVLAGAYANLAWGEETRRGEVTQLLEDLPKDVHVEADVYRELLMGAFTCDQTVQTMQHQLPTLLSEVADDYVTQRYRKIYRDTYPWWEGMISVIDAIDPTKPELAHWCEARRNEKARYEHNKQRIERGLPPRRLLWPLELSDDANKSPDANYSFPPVVEKVDDIASQTSYSLSSFSASRKISAFDICQDYLSQHNHHLVTGNRRAGKTWLRLYLEYFSFMTDEKLLPLFYFAPASLAFQTSVVEIIQNLARSVANHLFADLLVRSGNRTPTSDPWRASRVAIVPFLQRYGYGLPSNEDSLAQPIPLKQLLDIDMAYGKSYLASVYTPMKEAIDAVPFANQPTPTVDEILDDIQRAIELAGYQRIFVLVDNWDELQAIPRRRLLGYLLDPHLLSQLSQRGIFLKLFMPESATTMLSYFDKSCELKRASTHQLTLYTYAESKPVQTSGVGA